jgi:hypothetical protein
MYNGSWELTSRRNVKSLHREVLSAVPGVPKATPHKRWRSTTISFGASDCPKNMAGAGVLPLITAPIIANMRLHHVLIDGGAGLNVISHAAFKQLQILGSRLGPSRPFSGVGPQLVYPLGSIALAVTFGTEENVMEPPKSLGIPTVVLVQRTSDNPAGTPDHLTSSVSEFLTLPRSVSPVTQTLQYIGGTKMRKQLQ